MATDSVCSLNLNVMINIPKRQCSFTLRTTACIAGGVTSHSLSLVFLNIQNHEAKTVQIESVVIVVSSNRELETGLC